MQARIWLQSVDKYGRRRPTLIFTVIASPPKPLEEFCRNLAYEFFSVPRCVRPKMITVRQQYGRTAAIFKIAKIFKICPFLNNVTISFSHLLRDHWSDFFETCPRCFPSVLVVHAPKMVPVRRQPSLIFTVIASPPKPQEEFCRNLAYEFLSVPRCVRRKQFCSVNKYGQIAAIFKSLIALYLTL